MAAAGAFSLEATRIEYGGYIHVAERRGRGGVWRFNGYVIVINREF